MRKVSTPPPVAKVTLPTEAGVPEIGASEVGIIYGTRKVGKSWLAADFPRAMILDLEKGSKFLRYHPKYGSFWAMEINTIAELRGAVMQLRKGEHPCETIVLDSVTVLNQWAEDEVMDEMGTRMGTAAHGVDWAASRNKVLRIVDALRECDKRVILVAHLNISPSENGLPELRSLEVTGKLKSLLCLRADWIGYLTREDDRRVLWFPEQERIEGGSRYPGLQGKKIEASYEAFAEAIGELEKEEAAETDAEAS